MTGAHWYRAVYFIEYHQTSKSPEDKADLQFMAKVRDQITDSDQELLVSSRLCKDQAMFKHMRWKSGHLLRDLRKG